MTNKIYIIGGGRSGKSFLGEQLSQKTGIKHYDLDEIEFVEIGVIERDAVSKKVELDKILLSDTWIIEGAYTEEWVFPALKKTDMIIWLDTPPLTKLSRFFRKIISKGKREMRGFYGRGKLVLGLKHKEWDRSRSCYQKLLEPFKEKTTILKSKKDIDNFLNMEVCNPKP